MTHLHSVRLASIVAVLAFAGGLSAPVAAQTTPAVSDLPLFVRSPVPPLNMLVMGKDHKIYYEAYNDASDLNGDGILDVGYRGWETEVVNGETRFKIDYYGYFNSYACYTWQTDKFVPVSATANKQCSGAWSGDFLNYLTTSRMDALRRVLYGGWRQTDSTTQTVLQGAFFPQDAHSWGKEYQSVDRDGYNISSYAPLPLPNAGKYHLFAVTTVTNNSAPLFRVMQDSDYRVWNWLSIEGPVAGNSCFNAGNTRVSCTGGAVTQPYPGHPSNRTEFDDRETTYAIAANLYGSGGTTSIDCASNCNPHGADDEYLTIIQGQISIRNGRGGTYQFRVDGDDAIDFSLSTTAGALVAQAGCYGSRGFGACGGAETSAAVTLSGNTTYNFEFRQEEGSGGDGYRLQWHKTGIFNPFDWRVITGNQSDAAGNGNLANTTLTTYDLTPTTVGTVRNDYLVRVVTCLASSADVRESTCKAYPNGGTTLYKPTGILHDYGETQKMYFGLITGSQANNLEGGILRRNMVNFADEIDADTGQFRTDVDGIARSIDRLRMIGGGYNGSVTDNLNGDTNWNWANAANGVGGNCASQGDRVLNNGECRMWGNPVAEMLYESLRYFAGAEAATPRFATGGSTQGQSEDTALALPAPTWKDPYKATAAGGLGHQACAKPFQTVISDINPSYDGDLPGSGFTDANTGTGVTPASIGTFDARAQGDAIWGQEPELGGSRNVFIGEVAGTPTDGAPTAKAASSLGNIRGLAPEEPTKGGTYYSASVARFGYLNDINAAAGAQNLATYSIALASPLPRIEFPVNGRTITLLPFAKTVSGTFGSGTRKPTNTIVDFYVEQIGNLPGQPTDDFNGGFPYAVFRINYEDVEQGNDHDMDAIVKYEILANANNTVTVNLTSEYAAGSADQNIGYIISGTDHDGIYLEVRDRDGPGTPYVLNTPPGTWAGDCAGGVGSPPCNQALGLTASRIFSPTTSDDAVRLKDPLWYAAKYGGFNDLNEDGVPQIPEFDEDRNGTPDNYFLVTNPLTLRQQMQKAFDSISDHGNPDGSVGQSSARIGAGSFTVSTSFNISRAGKDWAGNVTAFEVNDDGTEGAELWNAQDELPPESAGVSAADRNIVVVTKPGVKADPPTGRIAADFEEDNLGATPGDQYAALGMSILTATSKYGSAVTPADVVDFLRGDDSLQANQGGRFRERSTALGDIVNSTALVSSPRDDYGYRNFDGVTDDSYQNYLADKEEDGIPIVYAGANDGMLHAFSGRDADGGEELFAFIPHGVLNKMGRLADPDYLHTYFVDGRITVADAKIGGSWQTLLAGTTGAGGKSVFALNVTGIDSRADFGASNVLWELNGSTNGDIGYTFGKPLILPLENGDWAVLFGNGYDNATDEPSLYIVDAATGVLIEKLTATDGNPDTANGRINGLGQIAGLDLNRNGRIDTVYGGDLLGNVWRFDLSGDDESDWSVSFDGESLFTAKDANGDPQPITGGFRIVAGPLGGVSVFFGTGRYFAVGDNDPGTEPQVQSLYGVWDNTSIDPDGDPTGGTPVTAARGTALVEQTVSDAISDTAEVRNVSQNAVNYYGSGGKRGWFMDLRVVDTAAAGEMFIGNPRVQSGKVDFVSFEPTMDGCTPGGARWLYTLDVLSGAGALSQLSVSPSQTPACSGACGSISLGDGPPIIEGAYFALQGVNVGGVDCVVGSTPDCVDPSGGFGDVYEECRLARRFGDITLTSPRPCGRQSWRQIR